MPRFKFPDPQDYPAKVPAVLCPADRVLSLYNQDSGEEAQRISASVRTWFYSAAHSAGWGGAHFLPEVQSLHGAGCLLWVGDRGAPGTMQITVNQGTLVILDSSEQE